MIDVKAIANKGTKSTAPLKALITEADRRLTADPIPPPPPLPPPAAPAASPAPAAVGSSASASDSFSKAAAWMSESTLVRLNIIALRMDENIPPSSSGASELVRGGTLGDSEAAVLLEKVLFEDPVGEERKPIEILLLHSDRPIEAEEEEDDCVSVDARERIRKHSSHTRTAELCCCFMTILFVLHEPHTILPLVPRYWGEGKEWLDKKNEGNNDKMKTKEKENLKNVKR